MKRVYAVATGVALSLASVLAGPGLATADQLTSPTGQDQLINKVIQRALSQRGVPFVYGGGDVSGPTTGARAGTAAALPGATAALPGISGVPGVAAAAPGVPGAAVPGVPDAAAVPGAAVPGITALPGTATAPTAGTVGFDSSGLIQYAFAGAGIKMPRTSGQQCNVGHKVAPAQARPGDLICFGPGGSQSVALYLGNGQMIEGTDPVVAVSQVRGTSMVPYLTRIIGS